MPQLPEILQPAIIQRVISQLRVHGDRLTNFFNIGVGGGAVDRVGGRYFGYDVFDNTRKIPHGRAPGAASGTREVYPVGHVNGVFPRTFEKTPLAAEYLSNLRQVGGPAGALDKRAETYILRQLRNIRQELTNLREFQAAAMIRGSYTYSFSGDNLVHDFSGGTMTVNFQVPTGNKTTLDMKGAGAILATVWSSTAAPVVDDLYEINDAFEYLTGYGLAHVWVSSVGWKYITSATQCQTKGGPQFSAFEVLNGPSGSNDFTARLRAAPWVLFHITDGVLTVNGTVTKIIPDDRALFCPDPSPEWISYGEGSEPIAEEVGDQWVDRFGSYVYARTSADPTGLMLYKLHNGLPFLYNPSNIAWGTIA